MALVYRNGRPYLYRSVRKGGRVTSEYRGSGDLAVLIGSLDENERAEQEYRQEREREERLDENERAEREYRQEREREERQRLDERDRQLDELVREALDLARHALERAGYHQHHRGEWRKRRMSTATTKNAPAKARRSAPPAFTPPEPQPGRMWRRLDLVVADSLVNRLCGKDEGGEECRKRTHRDIRELAEELAGPDPSPIEETLAVSAALVFAELRMSEAVDALGKNRTFQLVEHDRRRIERAHRRYLSILKTLATVRRLALPGVQVNVAHQQQVNNAGTL